MESGFPIWRSAIECSKQPYRRKETQWLIGSETV
jgi:hypothetical protein